MTNDAVVQLPLLAPSPQTPGWVHEGAACAACANGHLYLVVGSDPCACVEQICICLAEGYAKCDGCGELQQVWPREMTTAWQPPSQRP